MITPEELKTLRKHKDLSQVAFAKHYGFSEQTARLTWEKDGISDKVLRHATGIVQLQRDLRKLREQS